MRFAPCDIETISEQRIPQKDAKVRQLRAFGLSGCRELHSRGNLPGKVRRQSRVENKCTRAIDQETPQRLRAANERAGGRERFAASVHGRKHAPGKPRLCDAPAAPRPKHACRMSFIDNQFSLVTRSQRGNFAEWRAVPIHAENTFDDDESRAGSRNEPSEAPLPAH